MRGDFRQVAFGAEESKNRYNVKQYGQNVTRF